LLFLLDLLLDKGFKRKQRIATTSKRTVEEVNRCLDRFRLTREAFTYIAERTKAGKQMPKTQEEMMEMVFQDKEFLRRFRSLKINPSVMQDLATEMQQGGRQEQHSGMPAKGSAGFQKVREMLKVKQQYK